MPSRLQYNKVYNCDKMTKNYDILAGLRKNRIFVH